MINPLINEGIGLARHAIMRTLSVICVLLVCVGLYWAVYRTFIKPRATESYAQVVQSGGINYNIEIYNPEDTFFLGVKIFGLKFGITKPTVKKIKDITEEVKSKK